MKKDYIITTVSVIIGILLLIASSFMVSNYKSKEEKSRKYDVSVIVLNNINVDKLQELYKGDELSFIYIGKDNCNYCSMQNKVIKQLLEEYNIIINYLKINKFHDIDLEKYVVPLHDSFKEKGIGTPTLMLVKDSKIVMFKRGYTSKSDLVKLLKENKFL